MIRRKNLITPNAACQLESVRTAPVAHAAQISAAGRLHAGHSVASFAQTTKTGSKRGLGRRMSSGVTVGFGLRP